VKVVLWLLYVTSRAARVVVAWELRSMWFLVSGFQGSRRAFLFRPLSHFSITTFEFTLIRTVLHNTCTATLPHSQKEPLNRECFNGRRAFNLLGIRVTIDSPTTSALFAKELPVGYLPCDNVWIAIWMKSTTSLCHRSVPRQ
jgi:hypothetical protein